MKRRPQPVLKQIPENYLRRCIRLCGLWLLLLTLAAPAVAETPAYVGERLTYTISYNGILSAMNRIEIADAVLKTDESAFDGQPVFHSQLQVSTEAYGKMERFYPLRYRFESYFSTDLERTLLFDEQKKTKKDQREIVWVNWRRGVAKRYKSAPVESKASSSAEDEYEFSTTKAPVKRKHQKRRGQLPRKLSGLTKGTEVFRKASGAKLGRMNAILDQLSLLQAVRARELVIGQEIKLPALDGNDLLDYRIKVVKRERIEQQGRVWDTYKLQFDGFKQGDANAEMEHPPMYVWLTTDERRVPVRFVSDYALGRFAGELRVNEGLAAIMRRERIASLP